MPCLVRPICLPWLACAIAAALPATLFAQDKPGAVLPPPSLYDSPPPPKQPDVTPEPRAAQPAPRAAEPAPMPPAVEPASPPVRAAEPVPMPAPVQAEAVPVPRAVEPAPAPAQQPWYKRMWGTMSGWFGGGDAKPAQPAPAPQATAPVPASSAPAAGRAEGFAGDAPQRTIRTGAGDCVKTGTWDPSKGEAECPGAETMARAAPAAPMPAPAAQPMPQPVEVQPLPTPQLKEEAALEPEPPSLPPPAPPEPPLAAEPPPAPAEPQMLTLSADALFAVGSYQLKPSARAGLDDLVARLKEVTFQAIKITGHTDPTGSTTLNERLSLQRADEVKRYLVTHGVSATKIETEGMGSSMPMVIERDCAKLPRDKRSACYQPDRRVEIEVTGASEKLAGQ